MQRKSMHKMFHDRFLRGMSHVLFYDCVLFWNSEKKCGFESFIQHLQSNVWILSRRQWCSMSSMNRKCETSGQGWKRLAAGVKTYLVTELYQIVGRPVQLGKPS